MEKRGKLRQYNLIPIIVKKFVSMHKRNINTKNVLEDTKLLTVIIPRYETEGRRDSIYSFLYYLKEIFITHFCNEKTKC